MVDKLLLTLALLAWIQAAVALAAPSPAAKQPPATQAAPAWRQEPEDPHQWPREPFKKIDGPKAEARLQGTVGGAPELVLQGIMKTGKHHYALINGRAVKAGEHIDQWTVTSISRHRVTVRRDNEQQIFDIYQGRINRGTP